MKTLLALCIGLIILVSATATVVTGVATEDGLVLDDKTMVDGWISLDTWEKLDLNAPVLVEPSTGADDGVSFMPVGDPVPLEKPEFWVPGIVSSPPLMPDKPDAPDIPKPLDPNSLGNCKFVIEYNSGSIIVFRDYIFDWDDDEIHPDVYGAHIPILEIPMPIQPGFNF